MEFDAAVLFGAGEDLRLVRVDAQDLRPDEVLVRIVAAGICHTDLTVQRGLYPVPLPLVLGHEGSGIVERTGAAVSDLAPGDHVVLSFMSCGACGACSRGAPSRCTSFGMANMSGLRADGSTALCSGGVPVGGHFFGQSSFARYSVANRRNAVKVRADAPLALIAPFGCGLQTGAGAIFNTLRPEPGSSCVIFGAGGVGQSAVMAAKVLECDPIIVVEPQEQRRTLALEVGASLAVDPAAESDLAARLREATGGGAAAAVETTGIAEVVGTAIAVLGQGGRLGLVGMHHPDAKAQFTILDLIGKSASVHGIVEGESEPHAFIPYLVNLFMEGRFPADRLVTLFPFEAFAEAMTAQADGAVVKAVLHLDAEDGMAVRAPLPAARQ